jgi:uncharacterized damage-inducible protein DinB
MHGTLNHLLVTNRIWMQRFTGEGGAPDRLHTILFDAFAPLRGARRRGIGALLVSYVEALDDRQLAGVIKYRIYSAAMACPG